jgi:predicted TIM-barrel enzyme
LNKLKINEISQKVIAETQLYARTRVDGLIFENMHDLPYSLANNLGPETSTAMTRVCLDAIRTLGEQRKDLLLGVQILACGNREALAVAQAAGRSFLFFWVI